jgi:hypothetical protein
MMRQGRAALANITSHSGGTQNWISIHNFPRAPIRRRIGQ